MNDKSQSSSEMPRAGIVEPGDSAAVKAEETEEGGYVVCTIVGDQRVGKSALPITYAQQSKSFSDEYTPTLFDNYAVPVEVSGVQFTVSLFDTCGNKSHETLRAHTYQSTEVVVLCFSLCDRDTLYSIIDTWLPEVRRHTKQHKRPQLLLVGTQADLRSKGAENAVSEEEGIMLASMIGADCYLECSAKHQQGLEDVFRHAVLSALRYRCRKDARNQKPLKRLLNLLPKPIRRAAGHVVISLRGLGLKPLRKLGMWKSTESLRHALPLKNVPFFNQWRKYNSSHC